MSALSHRVLRPAALLLLLPLASATPSEPSKPAAPRTTLARPQQGAKPDPQVIAQFGLYNNPKLQAYITQQGKRMTAISDRPGDYGFTIVDSPVINAFATPDGHVYFTRGIMAYFNDEAQFTGVLGHELGHITAQHGKKQQRNSIFSSILVAGATIISPNLLGRVAQPLAQVVSLKYSRTDENEADGLGVKYSTKVGYDASHMANFFQTLERTEAQSGSSTPTFLSTHPNSADRYQRVKQLAAQAQQSLGKRTLLVNRDSYLRSIEGLPFGDDPRQGFVENSVFYHPDLKFRFPIPAGWKSQNSPEQFQMAEPNGKALLAFLGVPGSSLDEAAQALAKQIGITAGNVQRTTINGFPALVFEGDQQASSSSSATPAHVQSFVIQDGKSYFAFVGLATAATFGTYAPQFASTVQGYQRLTEASKLNRQPEHIHIKQVKSATTLSAALTANGVPGKRLEEEAILNGMQLTDRLAPGTLFKVIGQ
ncbi:M48 family metalloprotease [Hymenobacter cheonanensis]|uniref:M48 family metalloprotease n=1 Tax=Hymenobacter sp. CA2-7 TaxID=3063993 RepID=UPI002713192E|nr:M48 family metalloprotease [Hymenobacter sp. CA2-7]MDO7883847.1 M48 family metalloprotease [Hymenobacter sp. CA2-7]